MLERQQSVNMNQGGAVAARDDPAPGGVTSLHAPVIQRSNALPPGLVTRLESIERAQQDTTRRLLDIQDYILNNGRNVGTAAHIHDRKPMVHA